MLDSFIKVNLLQPIHQFIGAGQSTGQTNNKRQKVSLEEVHNLEIVFNQENSSKNISNMTTNNNQESFVDSPPSSPTVEASADKNMDTIDLASTTPGTRGSFRTIASFYSTEITAHDLQLKLLEKGHIIPVDVTLSHFAAADDDNSNTLAPQELSDYLDRVAGRRCGADMANFLCSDPYFWKGVWYTVAGALLTVGSFASLDKTTDKQVDLASSLLYACVSFYFVVTYPWNLFRNERNDEETMFELRESVDRHARQFAISKSKDRSGSLIDYKDAKNDLIEYVKSLVFQTDKKNDTLSEQQVDIDLRQKINGLQFAFDHMSDENKRVVKLNQSLQISNKNLMYQPDAYRLISYLAHEVFGDKTALTERDIELFILKEIKTSACSRFIKKIFQRLDAIGDHEISLEELHSFMHQINLEEKKKNTYKSTFQDAINAVLTQIAEISWVMSVCFFVAYLIKSLKVIVYMHDKTKLYIGAMDASAVSGWLKIVGTMEFITYSVNHIQHEYDEQRRARAVLKHFLYTFYMKDVYNTYNAESSYLKKFHEDKLDKTSLRALFDESSIFLPGHLFDHIFHEIDENHNGFIQKEELEQYLEQDINPKRDVFVMCLQNFGFWASTSLFLGSIFFLVSYYMDDYSTGKEITDQIGSVLHLFGGVTLVNKAYIHQLEFIHYAAHLRDVIGELKAESERV